MSESSRTIATPPVAGSTTSDPAKAQEPGWVAVIHRPWTEPGRARRRPCGDPLEVRVRGAQAVILGDVLRGRVLVDVARATGIKVARLVVVLNGERSVTVDELVRLCHHAGIDLVATVEGLTDLVDRS